jgi:membrane protease YdiL (CAAX protease family)
MEAKVRTVIGVAALYAVLQGAAAALGSTHGEWGFAVAALVAAAALGVQRVLHREGWRELGVGPPKAKAVWLTAGLSAVLLLVIPLYLAIGDADMALVPNAAWLALGMFAQGGIAEELVFRGYLYGRLRRGRSFWRAAAISAIPFAGVHLTLFFTMPWPIALIALAISVALTFPLARLYELGGRAIWAPALLHAVIQIGAKLFVVDSSQFPLLWMAASAAIAWLVFLAPASLRNKET